METLVVNGEESSTNNTLMRTDIADNTDLPQQTNWQKQRPSLNSVTENMHQNINSDNNLSAGTDLRERTDLCSTNQVNSCSNAGTNCITSASNSIASTVSGASVSNSSANALAQLKVDLENITHAQAFASAIVATINQEFYGGNGHTETAQPPNDQDQLEIKKQQQLLSNEVRVQVI